MIIMSMLWIIFAVVLLCIALPRGRPAMDWLRMGLVSIFRPAGVFILACAVLLVTACRVGIQYVASVLLVYAAAVSVSLRSGLSAGALPG